MNIRQLAVELAKANYERELASFSRWQAWDHDEDADYYEALAEYERANAKVIHLEARMHAKMMEDL
jgi:hypothetical protein